MWYETAGEFIGLALSSAGLAGSLISVIIAFIFRRAGTNAARQREERLKLDMLRLEGEEKLSELIYSLIRFTKGSGSLPELDAAEKKHREYLESARRMKNEIISYYTMK